jgi:AraC-like DNA-binding protein
MQELAERACMSRSAFALRFKEKVGTSVMEYLTQWRMLLAGDRLMNSHDSVSVIALSLGYELSGSRAGHSLCRCWGRYQFKMLVSCSRKDYRACPGCDTGTEYFPESFPADAMEWIARGNYGIARFTHPVSRWTCASRNCRMGRNIPPCFRGPNRPRTRK